MAKLEDVYAKGAQKFVEAIPGNPNAVRCTFQYDTHEHAYGTYLLQKISNILFPDLTPKPIGFGNDSRSGKYYMDVERVVLDALHLTRHESRKNTEGEHNAHEIAYYKQKYNDYEKRREICAKFDKAGLLIDVYSANWTLAENKIRHVDTSNPWGGSGGSVTQKNRIFNEEKLRNAIATLPDPKQRTEAERLLDELISLENKSV